MMHALEFNAHQGEMKMTTVSIRRLVWLAGLAGLVLLLVTACGQSTVSTQQPPNADVEALPGDRAEMQISLPDGTLPCGLGQVEWGQQVFKVEQFPACQSLVPDVTVYCLDDQAQWTADAITVTEVSMGTITLDAQREGICAIFAKK
jgi:hypothetical protein